MATEKFSASKRALVQALPRDDFVWALGSVCALNRVPFDAELLLSQFPPPHSTEGLIRAGRALGFKVRQQSAGAEEIRRLPLPCLIEVHAAANDITNDEVKAHRLALVTETRDDRLVLFEP